MLKSEDISDLIYEWLEDIKQNLQDNIENHKRNYETIEHYQSLVNEELNLILNENNKSKILNEIKINDELSISNPISNLFEESSNSNLTDFWNIARVASLSFIDQFWKNHLSEMDYLRSGIGLRAMGQRDPLVEYQKEGYDLFEELIYNVKLSVIRLLLNFDSSAIKKEEIPKPKNIEKQSNSEKIGRNDPCHCGSGLKYKKCHG